MAGKEPDTGATSQTVADNVRRFREDQNMNFTQLSERLQTVAGWSINAVGIRRIEAGERRVTPDDLVALALALGVSPISLLLPNMPRADDPAEPISITGMDVTVSAARLWQWLKAADPLPGYPRSPSRFLDDACPQWDERAKWVTDTDGDD